MNESDTDIEPSQKELLFRLVEADRAIPQCQRRPFIYAPSIGRTAVDHPVFPGGLEVYSGDIEVLKMLGLILFSGQHVFHLTPLTQSYYRQKKTAQAAAPQELEKSIVGTLTSVDFENRHSRSASKWREAYNRLWDKETAEGVAVIGHLCREAAQEFASELVENYAPSGVDADTARVKNRVRAVIDQRKTQLGRSDLSWVDALLTYWSALIDVVQKHEHAGQNQGDPLTWEDSRRLVYQCANVFFEIDRLLQFP